MQIVKQIVISILFLACIAVTAMAQTFRCDGSLILATGQGHTFTRASKVVFGPFGSLSYGHMAVFQNGHYDAMGFNSHDNFIYGVQANTNNIVRLKSDGSVMPIGEVVEVDTLQSWAGDCTPFGEYICYERGLGELLIFDVLAEFNLKDRIALFWDPNSTNSGPVHTQFDDLAIDPNNPSIAYTFQGDYGGPHLDPEGTRGFLMRIIIDPTHPEAGKVTPIAPIPRNQIRQIGSLFFNPNGALYGYGADSRGFNVFQDKLFTINPGTAEVSVFTSSGPIGQFTDGCSCPYGLSFENNISPRDALCTNSEITFSITIHNRFYQGLTDIAFSDTLPDGMLIKSVSGDLNGDIVSGTGIGSRELRIEGMDIPARTRITIDIVAQINDIDIELIENQAHLTRLPDRLGGAMLSDDPQTDGFVGDASGFYATPQVLTEFDVEVEHPTDCLDFESGRIAFSTPILIPGERYEVNLRNEDWEVQTWHVDINEQQSFVLENLQPGAYELFKIRPQTTSCSFAMKDTTIDIIAPNDLFEASIEGGGTICAGTNIELEGVTSPMTDIIWSGPRLSRVLGNRYFLDGTTVEDSGYYEMVATYGVCEQTRGITIDVLPGIDPEIIGLEAYCERDTMLLKSSGEGEVLSYEWRTPDGQIDTLADFYSPFVSQSDDGIYSLIMDNGACRDTAQKYITVNATPVIKLEENIETRYCDPLRLESGVVNAENVDFNWYPEGAVECFDCPNTTPTLPLLDEYHLAVNNQYGCADSITVKIDLLKDQVLYVPNVFSPNNDGTNDDFTITHGCGIETIRSVNIYNRWGTTVYSAGPLAPNDDMLFWDGTLEGSHVNPGVYFYIIELDLVDGSYQRRSGDVTVVR